MSRKFCLLLLLNIPILLACDGPVSLDSLRSSLSTGHYAYLLMDLEGFHSTIKRAYEQLACLDEVADMPVLASLHLNTALDRYLARDNTATIQAFQSLLALESTFRLSENLAPARHPLQEALARARRQQDDPTQALPPPRMGWLLIDGKRTAQAPTSRPFVLQWTTDGTRAQVSHYLWPGDPLPEYPSSPR